ncbi:unnamed protein product, partial [Mesorhabditis belari]|uniref:Uncharacterized protein n=1 Tax=Mesorhabditis belari TaxID=2138241 RepID=A0AAF3EBZ6_9BILA
MPHFEGESLLLKSNSISDNQTFCSFHPEIHPDHLVKRLLVSISRKSRVQSFQSASEHKLRFKAGLEEIEIESVNQGQRFGREYRLGNGKSEEIESPLTSVCNVESGEEHTLDRIREAEMKALLTNSDIVLLNNCVRVEMIDWQMKVKRITDPFIRNLDELFAIIYGLKVSELFFFHQPACFQGKSASKFVDRFLTHKMIQSLKWLKMECEQKWLQKFATLKIPKMFLLINSASKNESKKFLYDLEEFSEKIIKQWESGERELNYVHIYVNPWVYERKNYEMKNFVTDTLATKLTDERDGSFNVPNIDQRFRLIKRRIDSKGLLIVSGENGIIFVECDYNFRRNRGLGNTYSQILNLIDPIDDLLEGIWSHELTEWGRQRRTGKTKTKQDKLDEYHLILENSNHFLKILKLDEDFEREKAILRRYLDEWIAFSEMTPRRELAIDQLWNNLKQKINVIDSFYEYDSYPDELNFDNTKYKKALEFAEEYKETGKRMGTIFRF